MPETIARDGNALDSVDTATDAYNHLRAVARALIALLLAEWNGNIVGEDTAVLANVPAAVRQAHDIVSLSEYLADQMEALYGGDRNGRPYMLLENAIGRYRSLAKFARLQADDREQGGDGIYGLCEAMMGNATDAWEDVFSGGDDDAGALAKWEKAFREGDDA